MQLGRSIYGPRDQLKKYTKLEQDRYVQTEVSMRDYNTGYGEIGYRQFESVAIPYRVMFIGLTQEDVKNKNPIGYAFVKFVERERNVFTV